MEPATTAQLDAVYYGAAPGNAKARLRVRPLGGGAQQLHRRGGGRVHTTTTEIYDAYVVASNPTTEVVAEDGKPLNAIATVQSVEGLTTKFNRALKRDTDRGTKPLSRREAGAYLAGQDVYQRNRPIQSARVVGRIKASTPGAVLQMDTVQMLHGSDEKDGNKLSTTQNGDFNYLLTCVDVFTRVAFAVPIMAKTIQETSKAAPYLMLMVFDYFNALLRNGFDSSNTAVVRRLQVPYMVGEYVQGAVWYNSNSHEQRKAYAGGQHKDWKSAASSGTNLDRLKGTRVDGPPKSRFKGQKDSNWHLVKFRYPSTHFDADAEDDQYLPAVGGRERLRQTTTDKNRLAEGMYPGPGLIMTDRGGEFGYSGEDDAVSKPTLEDDADADQDVRLQPGHRLQSTTFRDAICLVPDKWVARMQLGRWTGTREGQSPRYQRVAGGYMYKNPSYLCTAGPPGTPNAQAYIESWHRTLRQRLRIQFDHDRPGALLDYRDSDKGRSVARYMDRVGQAAQDLARLKPAEDEADEWTGVDVGLTEGNDRRELDVEPLRPVVDKQGRQTSSRSTQGKPRPRLIEDAATAAKLAAKADSRNMNKMLLADGTPVPSTRITAENQVGETNRRWLWVLPLVLRDYRDSYHSGLKGVPADVDFRNLTSYTVQAKGKDMNEENLARLIDSDGEVRLDHRARTRTTDKLVRPPTTLKAKTVVRLSTGTDRAKIQKAHGDFAPNFANRNSKATGLDGSDYARTQLHRVAEVRHRPNQDPMYRVQPLGGGATSTRWRPHTQLSVVVKNNRKLTARFKPSNVHLSYA